MDEKQGKRQRETGKENQIKEIEENPENPDNTVKLKELLFFKYR